MRREVKVPGHALDLQKTRPFSHSFSYVCPEPVLVKLIVFSIKMAPKGGRFTHQERPGHATALVAGRLGGTLVVATVLQRRRTERPFRFNFSYVCPEPVLAK